MDLFFSVTQKDRRNKFISPAVIVEKGKVKSPASLLGFHFSYEGGDSELFNYLYIAYPRIVIKMCTIYEKLLKSSKIRMKKL